MGKHVPRVSRWAEADHSRIYACYTGCMLGFSLTVTPFRHYAKEYPKHRERMIRCFAELGANVTLPARHKDYIAQQEAIFRKVQDEIGRVAHAFLGWTLFGSAAMQFAIKHAFRSREAANIRRAAALYLDKMELPRAVLTKLGRTSRVDKDGRLSLHTLHTYRRACHVERDYRPYEARA